MEQYPYSESIMSLKCTMLCLEYKTGHWIPIQGSLSLHLDTIHHDWKNILMHNMMLPTKSVGLR